MTRLFPTELIGSYALTSWLIAMYERAERSDDLGESDLAETFEDAIRIALSDQERAGLDVVTDGEMRRHDFIQGFFGLITGINKQPPQRRLGAAGYDQNPRWEVSERVAAPDGLRITSEFAFLNGQTTQPTKICVPGPITLATPLILRGGYRDKSELIEDMIRIVNSEMKALVAAGATYIQVDEPRYATNHADAARLVEIFNTTREGVNARIGLHLCFGNFKGRSHDRRDYQYIFPEILNARCDQLNLEFANRENAQIELLRKIGDRFQVGVGVVDVKSYFVETPEEVAQSIQLAAEHCGLDTIVVTPDCGLNHCPRHVAFRKICAMVKGAALARDRLQGGDGNRLSNAVAQ